MTVETRERILSTAARLFHEQGFVATGVATILREADVNSGSLYHFFPSKDALLQGVLEWYVNNLYSLVMEPIEKSEADPVERVFDWLAWYRGFLDQNNCRLGCPIGNLALEVSDTHPQLRESLEENFSNWCDIVMGWLQEAGPRLPANCDRQQLACFVLTVMEGAVMQARASGDLAAFDASVAQLRSHFNALMDQAATEDQSVVIPATHAIHG